MNEKQFNILVQMIAQLSDKVAILDDKITSLEDRTTSLERKVASLDAKVDRIHADLQHQITTLAKNTQQGFEDQALIINQLATVYHP